MSDTEKNRSVLPANWWRGVLLATATLLLAACSDSSTVETAQCSASIERAAALKPLAGGDVAAFTVADEPVPLPVFEIAGRDGGKASTADFAGKTVLLNFILSQGEKFDANIVFFDKDRGADLFVRAAGGTYLPLKNGRPTGCAPLKGMELTPENKVFLAQWVTKLVGSKTRELSVAETRDIANAIDGLADLPVERRTIGALRTFLNNTDPEGIASRLRRWERGGPLGWVFDNVIEDIGLGDFGVGGKFVGYDMTDFLDNEEIRTPLMAYLFHRVEQLIDGRRIIIVIDEFWKALADEGFRDLAQNKLKTIRKQNGLMLFATQSPRDAINSPIAHTIIEQCPTQVFMPNSRGSRADYVDGFKLTEREYELIARELSNESRRFIVKQGHNSVVAELNLGGFDDELAVLSGRTANVELADTIRAETGDDPEAWLPLFQQQRSAG